MKKMILILTVLFFSYVPLKGQTSNGLTFNAGYFLPTGKLSDTHARGYGFEVMGRLSPSKKSTKIAVGINYTWLEGMTKNLALNSSSTVEIKYESAYMSSIFIGPQFTAKSGAYLLPAITFSFGTIYDDYDKNPFGLDVGAGTLIPIGSGKTHLEIGGRFSFTNIFVESIPQGWNKGIDLGRLVNGIRLYLGWNFYIF